MPAKDGIKPKTKTQTATTSTSKVVSTDVSSEFSDIESKPFEPRTTQPTRADEWFVMKSAGGKSPCIPGKDANGNVSTYMTVPNCFTGDTEFITDKGIKQLKDCVNQSVDVFTIDGWRPATVQYFGKQKIVEVGIGINKYFTTWNHRWPVFSSEDDSYEFVTTSDLVVGMLIKHMYSVAHYSEVNSIVDTHREEDSYCVVEPETHTFTLGGGHLTGNCVGYAWGRFAEVLGKEPSLWTGNAGEWFGYSDGYQHVDDPKQPYPGAVICFAKEGAPGHVAIVEEVHLDAKNPYILISESGYTTPGYTLSNPCGFNIPRYLSNSYRSSNSSPYKFQGFIYNPAVQGQSGQGFKVKTRLDVFIESAQAHLNEGNEWVCQVTGITSNQAWSAAFVVACAKQASSLLNVIIPNTYSCGAIGRIGRLREMGTWFRGPALGQQISPEVGDILLFRKGHYSITVNEYYADGCGIVTEYSGNIVTVIEGDSGGAIIQMSYIVSSAIISGCFRPDWSRADVQEKVPPSYNRIQGLYTDAVSKRDAAVREVGYLDEHYQPSINPSKVKLSMLNYTGLLGDLYSVFGGALTASDASKTSDESDFVPTLMPAGMNGEAGELNVTGANASVVQTCYSSLISKGLNSAAACGVLGNIKYESGFNAAAVGDNGTSFGLCQWHLVRGDNMKSYVGSNWANDVSGQMEWLWKELGYSYPSVKSTLLGVSNTAEGAAAAADVWVRKFEVPADVDNASKKRQAAAKEYFSQIVNQSSAQVQKTILQSVAT